MKYFLILCFFIFFLEYEHLLCILNVKEKKIWIPPMMHLLNNVVFTVNHLVTMYFYTFIYCFCECLIVLKIMISRYFYLLEILIMCFLHFPTNLISIIGLGIALHHINQILKTILNRNLTS